jgi:HAE1 family hydrophobic/amphiphilic exporter-1
VAFFPRTGIDAYAPLATVIIGGLTVGTLLALWVVPVLHTYTDDLAVWLRARVRRAAAAWQARTAASPRASGGPR